MKVPSVLRQFFSWSLSLSLLLQTVTPAFAFERSVLHKAPATGSGDIDNKLSRYLGQSQFANPVRSYGRYRNVPSAAADSAAAPEARSVSGTERRDIQESDIYKVHTGKKILYLLNNYRGLQLVSFEKGEFAPEIIGRVAPTGNYPQDMYIDEAQNRLLVLENNWADESSYTKIQSRIVVYDVSNPKAPKITKTIDLEGNLVDHRMVGHVLYIASSVRPDVWSENAKSAPYANVYSFNTKEADLVQVERLRLSKPLSWQKSMNISEVLEADGTYKYFLAAITTKNDDWWSSNRKSQVELVDISSPTGQMTHNMTAELRGYVEEKSQTFVKGDYLIVANNYHAASGDMQVAVESFHMRSAASKVMSEDDANLKVSAKKWELKQSGLNGEKLDTAMEAYLRSADGLRDVYVEQKVGEISYFDKKISDSVATARSSQEDESTDIRDVRVDGNLLYVFWRPENKSYDPLEIFDLTDPSNIAHKAHLEFPGWIERSVPFSYQGKKFVLGLGYVVPVANDENGARVPQAVIFEILERGTSFRPLFGADKTFAIKNAWSESLTGEDKELEVTMTGEGKGQVLLLINGQVNDQYQSGGKVFSFDMDKYFNVGPEATFTEGGFLVGNDSDWMRRVFTNPEIKHINSFSDMALGTYGDESVMSSAGTIKAMNILELARNIQSYISFGGKGLQVVSNEGFWWLGKEAASSQIRVTDKSHADAENSAILSDLKLDGSYVDHYIDQANQKLYVLTQSFMRDDKEYQKSYYNNYISVLSMENGSLKISAATTWKSLAYETDPNDASITESGIDGHASYSSGRFIALDGNRLLVSINRSVREVTMNTGNPAIKALSFANCGLTKESQFQIKQIGQNLLMTKSEGGNIKEVETPYGINKILQYTINSAALLSANGDKLSCSKFVNIPGEPVALLAAGNLLTEDTWAKDILTTQEKIGDKTYASAEFKTTQALASLKVDWDAGQAKLMDMADSKGVDMGSIHQVDASTLALVENEENSSWYRPYYDRAISFMSGPYESRTSYDKSIVFVSFENYQMLARSYYLDLANPNGSAQLVDIVDGGSGHMGIVRSGQEYQVIDWKDAETRPVIRRVKAVNANAQILDASDSFHVGAGYYWWSGSNKAIHFDREQMSLEFAQGLSGITQVYIQ